MKHTQRNVSCFNVMMIHFSYCDVSHFFRGGTVKAPTASGEQYCSVSYRTLYPVPRPPFLHQICSQRPQALHTPTEIPPQRGFHPSGNRFGLVTHRGDDGLTSHLRERPGPSGKQAQSCIKDGGKKENMFYLLACRRGTETGMWFATRALKPEADTRCFSFKKEKRKRKRLCPTVSLSSSLNETYATLLFLL